MTKCRNLTTKNARNANIISNRKPLNREKNISTVSWKVRSLKNGFEVSKN